jgi:hypothetical protein
VEAGADVSGGAKKKIDNDANTNHRFKLALSAHQLNQVSSEPLA